MRKPLLIAGGVLALLILALLTAPFFISEDTLKSHLVAEFEKVSGKRLTIEGAFKLKLFPFAGVYMETVTLSDKEDAQAPPLMTLKSLNVDVELMPLFSGNVIVQNLALDNPQINLVTDTNGQGNWAPPASKQENAVAVSDTDGSSAMSMPNLRLSGVKIVDGSVKYDDRETGDKWHIAKLNLNASLDGFDSPLDMDGDMEWNGKQVAFDAQANTLHSLLAKEKTGIDVQIKSGMLNASLKGDMKGNNFSGTMDASTASINDVMAWLDPKSKASLPAGTGFSVKSNASCASKACHFANVALTFGAIAASGDIKLNMAEALPVIDATLTIPELDITPFLPPAGQASGSWFVGDAVAESGGWSKDPIDVSVLRSFNGAFNIDAGSVRIRNIRLGKTTLSAKIQDGYATIDVPDIDFYKGTGAINAIVDARGAIPQIQREVTLKGIDLGAFLKDALGHDRFSGTADMQMTASTQGRSVYDFISALNGNGSIKIVNGAIKGYNIADMVRNVQAAFKQVDTSARQTDFAELSGTFTVNNGIVVNNDLSMKAPLFRLAGAGTVNLPQESLQYRLVPQFVDTLKGQGSDKQGIGVPVIVEGSLDNPSFRPDVRAIAEDVIKNPEAYKEKAKQAKEVIKDLKSMFKKKPAPAPAAGQPAPAQ